MMKRPPRDSLGFTLIEVIVAISVFAIMTVGLVPLVAMSFRGTTLSRGETVGVNAARDMLERIQGLKWSTSWEVQPSKVDVLDLFYPQTSSSGLLPGQSYETITSHGSLTVPGGGAGVFKTVCPPPSGTNPACSNTLPANYSMVVTAAFVKVVAGSNPQTYELVTPTGTYAYNSTATEAPPAPLMNVEVAVSWTSNGRARSQSLQSIVGDRRYVAAPAVVSTEPPPEGPAAPGPIKIKATAKLDYLEKVQTGYSSTLAGTGCSTPPCASDLNAVFLNQMSTVQSGDTVTADASTRTADVSIVRAYPSPQVPPDTPPADLRTFTGVNRTIHAPPTGNVGAPCLPAGGSPVCTAETQISHPDFAGPPNVAAVSGTKINANSAVVANGLPTATSQAKLQGNVCGQTTHSFTHNQADMAAAGYLRLDPTAPVQLLRGASGSSCFTGDTLGFTVATATALTPAGSRYVQARTTAFQHQFDFMKINYGVANNASKVRVASITAFTAAVDCKATPSGGAYATASWSATMIFRMDHTNTGSPLVPLNGMQATFNSSGNDTISGRWDGVNITTRTMPNALEYLQQPAINPLVYDGTTAATDIYLFSERDANGTEIKRGYFNSAVENKTLPTSVSTDGRKTSASIDTALRFDTNQLHASQPDSSFSVSLGKLSCEAEDNR